MRFENVRCSGVTRHVEYDEINLVRLSTSKLSNCFLRLNFCLFRLSQELSEIGYEIYHYALDIMLQHLYAHFVVHLNVSITTILYL